MRTLNNKECATRLAELYGGENEVLSADKNDWDKNFVKDVYMAVNYLDITTKDSTSKYALATIVDYIKDLEIKNRNIKLLVSR